MSKRIWCCNGIEEIQVSSEDEIPDGYVAHKRLFRKRPKRSENMKGHPGYWLGKKMPKDSRGDTLRAQYKSGERIQWNKGLKNDPRCKGHEPGTPAWNKGLVGIYHVSEEAKRKAYDTKKKNNSFNSSNPEEFMYEQLCNEFGKDNIIRQYKDSRYGNFICDFYIISEDKFIELHKHWTHGGKPFDPNDVECQEKLSLWKEKAKQSQFYRNAIQTWTVRDVEKAKVAKESNLNIEFIY